MSKSHSNIFLDFFFIKNKKEYYQITVSDICYIKVEGNYCKIVTETTTYLAHLPLGHFVQILSPDKFCHIHRSHIVSLEKIRHFDHDYVHFKDIALPIGDKQRKQLFEHRCVLHHPAYIQFMEKVE